MKLGTPLIKLNRQNKPSKRSGNLDKVIDEAFEKRASKSITLDKDKSDNNLYFYPSGIENSDQLNAWFKDEFEKNWAVNGRKKKDGTVRKSRKDAVVAIGVILKAPAEEMNKMSEERQLQFMRDAINEYEKISGFDMDAVAIHRDEAGIHAHCFYRPIIDGKYSGKEASSLSRIGKMNRELPKAMRAKGWEVDDYELDADTKKERKKMSANEYMRIKDEERAAAARAEVKAAKELKGSLTEEITKLGTTKQNEINELIAAQKELQNTENERADTEREKLFLTADKEDLNKEIKSLNSKKTELKTDLVNLKNAQAPLKKTLETEINTLNSEKNELKTELDTLKKSKKDELANFDTKINTKKIELGNLKSNIEDLEYEEKNLNSNISYLKNLNNDLNKNINGLFWKIFDRVLFLFKGLAKHSLTNHALLDYIESGKYEWIEEKMDPVAIIHEYEYELNEEQEYER